MTDQCFELEEAAEILALPDGHPRRRHSEDCPRCHTVLLSYSAFIDAPIAEESEADDAEARLSVFLESTIEGTSAEAPGSVRGGEGILPRMMRGLFARPVLAAATLVIVAAGVMWWHPWTQDRPVLRSTSPGETGRPLGLQPPQTVADGGVRLNWQPMDGADSYQERFYGNDLGEIARLDPVTGTTAVVLKSQLPPDTPSTVLWRVVALHNGDEIGVSPPAPLDLQ